MTVNRGRWSSIILVLVGVASLLLLVSACTSQDNEATALLQDPTFGLSHLNDEFHTIKGEEFLGSPKFGLAHLNDEFHTIKEILAGRSPASGATIPEGACDGLPNHAEVKAALTTARIENNGGFNLDMWGTVVNRVA